MTPPETPDAVVGAGWDSQGELLPEAAAVLLLWLHGVEEGQLDDVGPDGGAGAPADPAETHKRGREVGGGV